MRMKRSTTSDVGIRHQQLLAQTLRPATFSLLEKVNVKAGSRALCLNCGEGDVVFHLSGLVGDNGTVFGIDPNRVNIHTAQQLTQIKNIWNATFCETEQFRQGDEQPFEFIHCRLPLLRFFDPRAFIAEIRNQLIPGGMVLFEVIDFSGFNSTPKNFAFERFLDLYTTLIPSQGGIGPFSVKLNQLLSQSGFQGIHHQYVAPVFLQGPFRSLPSLTLESIREEVLHQKLSTEDELDILLYELKDFEQNAHSLMSLPGIHQIWGHKA